ncbi:MAG: TRAP transporter small permease [Ideonella sp.]|nr:TRAP transporter small permease [Ideonella sp.]
MKRLIDAYCKLLDALIALLLLGMVVLVFGNVLLRYGFNSGITISEELSRWMFVWLCFLGAVVAVKEHGHLGSDMLVSRLGPMGKKAFMVISLLAMLGCNWLLLTGSWAQARINLEVEAPVTGASTAIFYASGVVFAVSASLLMLRKLWRVLSGQVTEAELVMVQESEDVAQVQELHLDRSGTYKH